MNPKTFSSKNRRVTRIIEFHNNLCEKESRSSENDQQLPSLRLKIRRMRELIAVLSLYEDQIKYLSVDSNRIIPCTDDDRERIKFTECKIQLVVQIKRQNFWPTGNTSALQSGGGRIPAGDLNTSITDLHPNAGQSSLPAVNVEFRLTDPYPLVHTPDSLIVQITKVVNFPAAKQAALEELLRQQARHEPGPEVLYALIWSVTYFLHILDSLNDNDILLYSAESSQVITQLVCISQRHLTSIGLLDNVLDARQQAFVDSKRKRKLAHSQLEHFQPDPAMFDIQSQTFSVRPDDLIPSVLERKFAEQLFNKLTNYQFKDKHTGKNRKVTLRLESESTHCLYIKKLCIIRHRQDYAAFEPNSGSVYHFVRVAFELKPLLSEAPQMPEKVEQMLKTMLDRELLERLDKILQLELNRSCQFAESVHFSFQFNQSRVEFFLLNEAFPVSSEEYCSLEALSKTIGFHETGLLMDLRYRLLECVFLGFGHLHRSQFAHGSFEPKKMFISLSGAVKIFDVFLEAAAMQFIPFIIDSDESSCQKVQRTALQSLIRDDSYNVGSLVIALWSDCHFEPISRFLPEATVSGLLNGMEERLTKFNDSNVAHFAKECFKIYFRTSELNIQDLLNHGFVLEWQKKSIVESKKLIEVGGGGGGDSVGAKRPNVEQKTAESIPSSYDRSQREFFPVMSLGKGAFGSVFTVRNIIDGTEYALKCVHLRDTTAARNNLLREVNHLARLVHPNVVRYYASWFEYDTGHWEYLKPANDGDELNLEEYDSEYDFDEDEEQTDGHFDDIPESESDAGASAAAAIAEDDDDDLSIEFRSDSPENSSMDNTKNTGTSSSASLRKSAIVRTAPGRYEKSEQEKNGLRLMLCIQMELCDRCTLHDKIREGSLWEDAGARYRILKEMLSALAYIHSMDIIHRDLKPSNIFFVNGRVKIGDFGLARRNKQDSAGGTTVEGGAFRKVSTTAFGSIKRLKKMSINFSSSANTLHIGTAQYMAPEVTLDAHYNQKIDLFSLGVIFFEMFYPMATMSERARLLMAIRPTKTTASIFPDDMSKYFRQVEIDNLKRLLSANPSERPSAVELLSSGIFVLEDSKHQIESQQKQTEEQHTFKEPSHLSLSHLRFIMNRLFEKPNSCQLAFFVRGLMTLSSSWHSMSLIRSICYDYEGRQAAGDDLRKIVSFNQIKSYFEWLSASFGALKLGNSPTLFADANLGEDIVKVIDENGTVCGLLYDHRMALARYLAFKAQHLDFMICSNFSVIYRKCFDVTGHPRKVWTASLDQIWPKSWSEHSVLPFSELLTLSTRLMIPILHRGQLIYHFTSLELLKSICDHLKVPIQVWTSLIKLLQDNDERVLGHRIDELKLAFQLIFESAGLHERVHRFLFSLLKISTTNPVELLKNIQNKCQEFDVPQTQDLIQRITASVNHLERIVNLYYISCSAYIDEQTDNRIGFRFGLSLLAKSAVQYQCLTIHVVYEDIQCQRQTLLAIGGRFDCSIETQENILQQIMLSDMEEALTQDIPGNEPTKDKQSLVKHLDLVGDHIKSDNGSSSMALIVPSRELIHRRMALGLTFSIEKLSKLEWNIGHLKDSEKPYRRNDDYLIDVLVVTTMPTIDTCKTVQELRTANLRVQSLPELFTVAEREHFKHLFVPIDRKKSPKKSVAIGLHRSGVAVQNHSTDLNSQDRIELGILKDVIHYSRACKVHFILLIDTFKSPDLGVMELNAQYSVLECSTNSGLCLYRFYDDCSKACRFIRGDLSAPTVPALESKVQRSLQRLRQRFRKLKKHDDFERRLAASDGNVPDENPTPESIEDGIASYKCGAKFKELLRIADDLGGDKLDTVPGPSTSKSESVTDIKNAKSRDKSQAKKHSRKEDGREVALRKEKAKESRRLVKRTMSETQIRRSRSGSTISADHTPDLIDIGFVTGSKIDRQQVTALVNDFIGTKLGHLLNGDEKLKVLVTNLIPFSLLRTFADSATACFSEPITDLWRVYFSNLSELKARNRSNGDILEKIAQKLWAWIEERLNPDGTPMLDRSKEAHTLIVLMHVGEPHLRYRLVQLDFYD